MFFEQKVLLYRGYRGQRSKEQVICTGHCRGCLLGTVYLRSSPPSNLGSVAESSRQCWWKDFVSLQAFAPPRLWSQCNIYIPAQHNVSDPLKDRNEISTAVTQVTIRLACFATQKSFSWDIGKPVCFCWNETKGKKKNQNKTLSGVLIWRSLIRRTCVLKAPLLWFLVIWKTGQMREAVRRRQGIRS